VDLIAPLKPELPRRKRLRLAGFDYSEFGAYFVTICTRKRECLLGEVVGGQLTLNARAESVRAAWNEIPDHFSGIALDGFVIMPNHVHGILLFTDGVGAVACPARCGRARTLPVVVGSFKSAASRQIGERIWQRNYWERVIRNEDELNRIRTYIDENPFRWPADPENLARGSTKLPLMHS
jgi:putative transposase